MSTNEEVPIEESAGLANAVMLALSGEMGPSTLIDPKLPHLGYELLIDDAGWRICLMTDGQWAVTDPDQHTTIYASSASLLAASTERQWCSSDILEALTLHVHRIGETRRADRIYDIDLKPKDRSGK